MESPKVQKVSHWLSKYSLIKGTWGYILPSQNPSSRWRRIAYVGGGVVEGHVERMIFPDILKSGIFSKKVLGMSMILRKWIINPI